MNFLTQQQEVASELRLDISQGNLKTLLGRWVNQSGQGIWGAGDWNFALDRQIVQTVVDKTAGTVAVNTGAVAVTGTSTAWAASDVGSYIQFGATNDWYKITAVANATSLTIEVGYTGTANVTAAGYTVRKFFYSLASNTDRLLDAKQSITPMFVDLVDFREFDIFRPNSTATGDPNIAILYGNDSNGNLQMTLYPWPSAVENIECRYKKIYTNLVNDTDISPIPTKWHETVMIEGAIWRGLRYVAAGGGTISQAVVDGAYARYVMGIQEMKANADFDPGRHPVLNNRDVVDTIGPRLPFKYGI